MKRSLFVPLFLGLSLAISGCNAKPSQTTSSSTSTDGGKVVSQKELPKGIVPIENLKEHYPAIVASFEENAKETKTTYGGSAHVDYLKKYPFLKNLYKGYGFAIQYDRARGHVHALDDVKATKRPKPGASCFSCKVGQYSEAFAKDPNVAKMKFEDFSKQVTVGMTCWDCHKETPGEVQLSRSHLMDELKNPKVKDSLNEKHLACAQCHVEYYQKKDSKIVTLPWKDGMGCDEAYKYYEQEAFFDWEHPDTGAKLLKAQHPETETFEGSVHDQTKANCTTCHMPNMEVSGEKIKTHHWTSPLTTVKQSCLPCHKDQTEDEIIKLAESVQKPVVDQTDVVGKQLDTFITKLSKAKADGKIKGDALTRCQAIHREAQFYWDYVFVENSEGFHNWGKQKGYLDHAAKLLEEGLKILG